MITSPTTYAARFTIKMVEKINGYGTQKPKYSANRLTPGSSLDRSTIVVSRRTATDASTASFSDTSPPTAQPRKIAISDARSSQVSSRWPASDTRPNWRAMPPSSASSTWPIATSTSAGTTRPVANTTPAAALTQNAAQVT